jgi:hypothetical protein
MSSQYEIATHHLKSGGFLCETRGRATRAPY